MVRKQKQCRCSCKKARKSKVKVKALKTPFKIVRDREDYSLKFGPHMLGTVVPRSNSLGGIVGSRWPFGKITAGRVFKWDKDNGKIVVGEEAKPASLERSFSWKDKHKIQRDSTNPYGKPVEEPGLAGIFRYGVDTKSAIEKTNPKWENTRIPRRSLGGGALNAETMYGNIRPGRMYEGLDREGDPHFGNYCGSAMELPKVLRKKV